MKASELMIGDWVFAAGNTVTIHSIREKGVGYLTKEDGKTLNLGVPIDEIKPIPLTAEILKKNEFKEKENYSLKYRNKEKEPFLCIYIIPDELLEVMTDIHTIILEPSQLYVHELQHALRLCGLNEQADNFKI